VIALAATLVYSYYRPPYKLLTSYCEGVGKAYNQINGGSTNDDAFVD
jgi:hypothetical protein